VCTLGGDQEPAYYDFPYTLDADGEPVLGDPSPVQPAFVSGAAKARAEAILRKALSEGTDSAGGALVTDGKAAPSSGYDVSNNSIGASGRRDFAYVDSAGRGHLPIHNEGHVRAALGRFDQTQFESEDAKRAAAKKILRAAKRMGIDVDDASAVAMAAKGSSKAEKSAPDILSQIARQLDKLAPEVSADVAAADRLGLDTKAGRRMTASHLGQLHDAMQSMAELHAANCDMGLKCPLMPNDEKMRQVYEAQFRLFDIDLAL
jgi:hypothetical protein